MRDDLQIIGAGFSGLTTAFWALEAGFKNIKVFEATDRCGGVLGTSRTPCPGHHDGILTEWGPNALLNSESVEFLLKKIGLPFLSPLPSAKKRFLFDGKLHRWPLNPFSSIKVLSRFVFARESTKPKPFESVKTYGDRMSPDLASRLLGPALSGVYGANADELSASLTLRAIFDPSSRSAPPKESPRGSIGFKGGMGDLVSQLTTYLEKSGVQFLRFHEIQSSDIAALRRRPQSKIVLAVSLKSAFKLLSDAIPIPAAPMGRLPMVGLSSVTCLFPQKPTPKSGFGVLYIREAQDTMLGTLYNSCIFPERGDGVSETTIFRYQPNQTDEILLDRILAKRSQILGEASPKPIAFSIRHWPQVIPLYGVELERCLSSGLFDEIQSKGVFLVGNYLGRIGLSAILDRAQQVVRQW